MNINLEDKEIEFYDIIPEFNSDGRLCNYHQGEGETVKVMEEEWKRFNQLAGRQHEIIDGVVVYNESLEPCMPDDLIIDQLKEIEIRLLEILDQERLDEACGIIRQQTMTFGLSEKEILIQKRNELKQIIGG